ncbi:hypothetical protein JMA_33370 [Jeotgalibacillus malaysiensis]|uniref:Uncharacterized protein n=1 Tax=Jeotgalibacillus malaysiensis TaxID=1508404 RepID=A0A0B5AXA3_9BACL|nr:hypothetical protein [Jeotgalibacillus malaysiensis]AJD92654.1 hypothetical protein JMA_33370 [Jeotgalibacillus malaysiensis]
MAEFAGKWSVYILFLAAILISIVLIFAFLFRGEFMDLVIGIFQSPVSEDDQGLVDLVKFYVYA